MKSEQRILAKNTPEHAGETVVVKGWVQVRRDHGKLLFVDLRDRSGLLQVVFHPQISQGAYDIATTLRSEDAIVVTGKITPRPEKLVNHQIASGTVELAAEKVDVLAKSDTLPFDTGAETLHLELPTLLDYRSLSLKHPSQQAIFQVQATLADEFRKAAKEIDCTEVFLPTIAMGATEGGAEVFQLDYFGHKAFMTQSPQLYKQIMVGALERVFTITKAYRAEPSVTTRHLTEATQMDVEIAFIENFEELLDALEFVGTSMIKHTAEKHHDLLTHYNITQPLVPAHVPRLKLREAQEIVTKRTGRDLTNELDLNPEDEVEICKWASEEHNSDFVTITHFPTKKRAFYTYPDPADPEYSLSYDLLFRGLEILSGSQRINDFDQLVQKMKEKDVNPENFGLYMQAFQYGMPPEGGFSFGLERLTMKLLELPNVRQASLFPRDMERVDLRFSVYAESKKD